jgi:uncharacterized protein YuzE
MPEGSSTATQFKVDREAQAGYLTVRPYALVDRQRQIGPGTILDLDDEDNVVGIEVIGDVDPTAVLAQVLAVAKFPKGG